MNPITKTRWWPLQTNHRIIGLVQLFLNYFATNFAGTTTRADYVNLSNLDAGLPMLIPMVCGGSVLRQVGSRNYGGEECWIIETISNASDYKRYNPQAHPWLFYTPSYKNLLKLRRMRYIMNFTIFAKNNLLEPSSSW